MNSKIKGVVSVLGLGVLLSACGVEVNPDAKSGYYWAIPETQEMQNDDFNNPAMLWVDIGQDEWSKKDGEAGKSCASCHGKVESLKGVATEYPKFNAALKKPINMEQRINKCRTDNMKAKEFKWESDPLLGLTALVNMQSRGMPQQVKVDGVMEPFFKSGEKYFNTRKGMMGMACKNCHEDYPGFNARANTLTQGQINGFPTYRLKWQKVGSTHRRFRGCNSNVRAKKFGYGDDQYVNLEVYLKWRGRGLPIEAPSVRN